MIAFISSVLCGLCLAVGVVIALASAFPARRATASTAAGARGRRRLFASWPVRHLVLAAASAAGAWAATGWPVAAPITAAAVLGLPQVLSPPSPRRAIALQEALTSWTRRLSDLLAAGADGLQHALARAATTAPEPLAGPAARLVERMRTEGTEPALRAFAAELNDPQVDAVVLALLLRTRAGGRGLTSVLAAHAHALSSEAAARRGIEADRASSRTTVRCLVGITVALVAGLLVFAGNYLAPLNTPTGQGVLLVAALIAAGSLAWMRHLTSATSSSRYLAPSTPDAAAEGVR